MTRIPTFVASILFFVFGFLTSASAQVRFDGTLEKDLHANRVKAGDTFTVRVSSDVVLKDGRKIPKKSKLQGRVTEVKKSGSNEPSTIGVLFDTLILNKNEERPISVTLISVAPPAERRGVDSLSAQSGMSGAGRISAMQAESGRAAKQESGSHALNSGAGTNRGPETDPALSPGLSAIENVTLRYKASGPDTILENKKNDVYVPRWSKMLFQTD